MLGGEIVNADSVQLYKDHVIGAATPSIKDQAQVPHHLYGYVEGDSVYDVAQYISDLTQTLDEIHLRKKQPIVVGGSSLYVSSWLNGLSPLPPRSEELREQLEKRDSADLYRELIAVDPVTASRLHPNDTVRIVRALEIATLSGDQPSAIMSSEGKKGHESPVLILILIWPREELYARINARAKKMVAEGLVDETRGLSEQYGETWQCRKSLGYAQSLKMMAGDIHGDEELSEAVAQATRRYAKRQMTFWRNSPRKYNWDRYPDRGDEDLISGAMSATHGKRAEKTSIGFPCYSWSLPKLLKEFYRAHEREGNHEVLVPLCTCFRGLLSMDCIFIVTQGNYALWS